jgi:hypothetical protein
MSLVYDPVSDAIRNTVELPGQLGFHASSLLRDGRVLLACCGNPEERLLYSLIVTPATGQNERGPAMNISSIFPGTLHWPDGSLLVIGGADRGETSEPLSAVEYFDAGSNRWISFPSMHQARCLCTAVALLNDGRVAVFGGGDRSAAGLDTYEIYSPSTIETARKRTDDSAPKKKSQ